MQSPRYIYLDPTPVRGLDNLARACREGLLGSRGEGIPGEQAFDPGFK